jgi:hypothetical protein
MEPEYSINPLHDYFTDKPFMTQGEQLLADIGLEKYGDNVYIQKVLGYSIHIYLITFFSRYPNLNLGVSRVKKIKSTWIGKIKRKGIHVHLGKVKLTPPLVLKHALIQPTTGSIFIIRDISGEWYRDRKVFESYIDQDNTKLKLKEII